MDFLINIFMIALIGIPIWSFMYGKLFQPSIPISYILGSLLLWFIGTIPVAIEIMAGMSGHYDSSPLQSIIIGAIFFSLAISLIVYAKKIATRSEN